MIVKTAAGKTSAARTAIERLHAYETLAIAAVSIDIAKSGAGFESWIRAGFSGTIS